MRPFNSTLLCATLCALFSLPACADTTSPWLVRVGYARAAFDLSSDISVGGTAFSGAELKVNDKDALLGDVGYAVDDRWTARLALGVPPEVTALADGTLSSLTPPLTGKLGKATLVPVVMTATYGLGVSKTIRPYIGAGVSYFAVINEKDGDIAGLQVDNAWGPVLQVGCDVALDGPWSLFVDVKKIKIKSDAVGHVTAFGNAPVEATVTAKPLIVNIGLGYHF